MKKITRLRICNWSLLVVTIMMLASSIQQEGWWLGMGFVWVHIVLGILFFMLIGWHLQLHFQWNNWIVRLKQQKSPVTKWLALFGALTLLTAIVATVHVLNTMQHTTTGGVHGKFGFIFIALAIGHVVKRVKFYRNF